MNNTLQNALSETIQEAIDESVQAIIYNLHSVFGGLLYSLKLENETIGGVGDIDNLIRIIVSSSRYCDNNGGEEYPVWNEDEAKDIIARLTYSLQQHGIQQAWNIGCKYEPPKNVIKNLPPE